MTSVKSPVGDLVLRRLLWLRHGCSIVALYGDDGEMQCSACGIDFKRMEPEQIDKAFRRIGERKLERHDVIVEAMNKIAAYEYGYSTTIGNCDCPEAAQKALASPLALLAPLIEPETFKCDQCGGTWNYHCCPTCQRFIGPPQRRFGGY